MRLRDDRGLLNLHFSGVKIIRLSFRALSISKYNTFYIIYFLYYIYNFVILTFDDYISYSWIPFCYVVTIRIADSHYFSFSKLFRDNYSRVYNIIITPMFTRVVM